jgi:hypothetical protein
MDDRDDAARGGGIEKPCPLMPAIRERRESNAEGQRPRRAR